MIVAFAAFPLIRVINRLKREEQEKAEAPPPAPEEVLLLREIRDALRRT